MRARSCLLWLALCGCRADPGAAHLARELAFFQGYVDPARELAEVRRTLAQRQQLIRHEIDGAEFIAIAASQPDGPLSAVRIITRRGVAFGVDGDLSAPIAPYEVDLARGIAPNVGELSLVGVIERPHLLDRGCLRLYRVLSDGRLFELVLDVSRFGDRACAVELSTLQGRYFASVGWPALAAAGRVPTLAVELAPLPVLLGREEEPGRTFMPSDDQGWLARARGLFAADRLAGDNAFDARHGLGVARAAVAAAEGRGLDAQRAAYLSALLPVRAGSPEAAVVAETLAHIARNWFDPEDAPQGPEAGDGGVEAGDAGPSAPQAATDAEGASADLPGAEGDTVVAE